MRDHWLGVMTVIFSACFAHYFTAEAQQLKVPKPTGCLPRRSAVLKLIICAVQNVSRLVFAIPRLESQNLDRWALPRSGAAGHNVALAPDRDFQRFNLMLVQTKWLSAKGAKDTRGLFKQS